MWKHIQDVIVGWAITIAVATWFMWYTNHLFVACNNVGCMVMFK